MYQALYRKYRPQKFCEIVGQKAIVTTLKNSLETNKISHAYLFYGPRGTGKTTIAKLFAKSVNCSNLTDGEPCGHCNHCEMIQQKECVDIVEIDAASNNGVDEIRELKNKINLVPSSLKYKVYIIDEVHMLSIGAFNALLKTLEEPPEHVVFILATTEIHKVPATILSRCQCFCFQKIDIEDIITKLTEVVKKEQISIDSEVLQEIASSSDGGMRDALGMLDQLSSYTKEKITLNDYYNSKGTLSVKEIEMFISNIFTENIQEIIKEVQTFDKNGRNFIQIINQLIQYLHHLLIQNYILEKIELQNQQEISKLILHLNQLQSNMKHSENPKIIFEVGIIDFLQQEKNISREIKENQTDVKTEELSLKQQEEVLISQEMATKKERQESASKIDETLVNVRINNTFARASKDLLLEIKEKIPILRESIFDKKIGFLVCLILDGTVRAASDENIIISYEYESMVEKAWKYQGELANQILNLLNIKANLIFITDEKWKELRKEFISKKEQQISYQYIDEPKTDQNFQNDIKKEEQNERQSDVFQKAVDIFGSIVEIES